MSQVEFETFQATQSHLPNNEEEVHLKVTSNDFLKQMRRTAFLNATNVRHLPDGHRDFYCDSKVKRLQPWAAKFDRSHYHVKHYDKPETRMSHELFKQESSMMQIREKTPKMRKKSSSNLVTPFINFKGSTVSSPLRLRDLSCVALAEEQE